MICKAWSGANQKELVIIKLLFLSDKLMKPIYRKLCRLPLEFVCFAHTGGKMYRSPEGSFVVKDVGTHGNSVVYGAIYILNDDYFHIRTLDGLYGCSKSIFGRNHQNDMTHRERAMVTPITFGSIDELNRLMYEEMEPMEVEMYLGNKQHPTIKKRIERTQKFNYRIKNGVDEDAFLAEYRGLNNGTGINKGVSNGIQ